MRSQITRRNLIKGGVSLSVASTIPFRALSQSVSTAPTLKPFHGCRVLASEDRAVHLYTFFDKEYIGHLKKHFPNLIDDPMFQSIAPVSAILHHCGGPDLVACSVNYDVVNENGTFRSRLTNYSTPKLWRSTAPTTPISTADSPLLASKGWMVVTPYFTLTESQYKTKPITNWYSIMARGFLQTFLTKQIGTAAVINVFLDSAAFADHIVLGKDRARSVKVLNISRHVESKIALWTRLRLDAGRSSHFIRQKLVMMYISESSQTSRRFELRTAAKAKSRYAAVLATILKHGGRQGLYNAISSVNEPRPYFVNSV